MCALQAGQKYALSTEGKSEKSLFFVKLTDSALQSIEMSLNSGENSLFKPTIQFEDNSGTIILPINGKKQSYRFTLSNIETSGLHGSFECVQHTSKWCLESLGTMLKKMHINAKEDSYEKMKFKMEAADKEQKSFCTKEIKPNGAHLGRNVRLKRPGLTLPPEQLHAADKKPEPSKFLNLNNKSTNSSALLLQPVRQRIIHILAVKPYKKPEILLRLMKEGISSKDKNNINDILTTVGTLRGNIYHLANHLWEEVQDDWKFCTKEESHLIQRRKQHFFKLSGENEVQDPKSPDNFSAIQNGESSIVEKEPLNKKRKVSHNDSQITDKIIKDNSSVPEAPKKIKFQAVDSFQKLPSPSLQVNGNCNGTGPKNITDSVLGCKKDFLSSKSSKVEILLPDNLKISKLKYKNSKNVHEKAVVNNNHVGNSQNRVLSSSLTDSGSHSNVLAKGFANSYCQEQDLKRYESSIANSTPANKASHSNGVSAIDISKTISPVSYSNSFPSLNNEDSNKYVELLAQLSSQYLKDKYYKKYLFTNQHSIQQFLISCYRTQIGSHIGNSFIIDLASEVDYSDIEKKYSTVTSKEQRSEYAKEFNTQYEEYLQLHAQMKEVSEKFVDLENSLYACKEGSREFKKIILKLQKESRSLHQNSDYIHKWKKFNMLQSKLAHIKNIIKEYDCSQNGES